MYVALVPKIISQFTPGKGLRYKNQWKESRKHLHWESVIIDDLHPILFPHFLYSLEEQL